MKEIPRNILNFFKTQHFVVVSTLDERKSIHCSAKGLAEITPEGKAYLIDVYRAHTLANLKADPRLSITAIDEHQFVGYTLKGKASLIEKKDIHSQYIENWRKHIVERMSHRVITNVRRQRQSRHHPESDLPDPEYLIEMEIEDIVDLTPSHLKRKS
jgi:general stress protein 26